MKLDYASRLQLLQDVGANHPGEDADREGLEGGHLIFLRLIL